jgi:hypothetical protein
MQADVASSCVNHVSNFMYIHTQLNHKTRYHISMCEVLSASITGDEPHKQFAFGITVTGKQHNSDRQANIPTFNVQLAWVHLPQIEIQPTTGDIFE